MKQILNRYRLIIAVFAVILSLLIAAIYAIITPSEAENVSGLSKIVLTYSHSVVWILLAAAAASWAIGAKKMLIVAFAYAALVVYTLFLVLLIM